MGKGPDGGAQVPQWLALAHAVLENLELPVRDLHERYGVADVLL